jgi:hypothetical protein
MLREGDARGTSVNSIPILAYGEQASSSQSVIGYGLAVSGTVPASAPSSSPSSVPVVDSAIEDLDLHPIARAGAYLLKSLHPSVVFTSGRRTRDQQANAMAANIVQQPNYVTSTYVQSAVRDACVSWLNNNPNAVSQAAIKAGLTDVFGAFTDDQMAKLSKHLSGRAFDVQPTTVNAQAIKGTISGLPGLTNFMEVEAGLIRWHAQF